MNEKIKQEFVNRYDFLFNNVDLIMMPRVVIRNDMDIYLDIDKDFLDDLESFLLSDIEYDKSNLYKKIDNFKRDYRNVLECKYIREFLCEKRKKKYIDNFDVKTIFQTLRNYILSQDEKTNKTEKLLALDEYFRFNRYNNSSLILKGGAILGFDDLGSFCENLRSEDKIYGYKNSNLINSNFISYISNMNNHYKDNNSIFTEDEKQVVYLKNHPGSIPWNKTKALKNNINCYFFDI